MLHLSTQVLHAQQKRHGGNWVTMPLRAVQLSLYPFLDSDVPASNVLYSFQALGFVTSFGQYIAIGSHDCTAMTAQSASRTLFFFEKPSTMRQLQRFFKSPTTVCVAAEGHLLAAEEPGNVRDEWKPWRFDTLPIVIDRIPLTYGNSRSGKSHKPKIEEIKQALHGADRVIIATDPGREGSMIAWEVLEHLGYRGRVDRLKLGALDDLSIRRAFAAMAAEPDSGERDYASYLEALCRQYEDYHLGLNGTRAVSLRLRPPAFKEPWRFGGVQTPTLAILADLEQRILDFVPQDYFKIALAVATDGDAEITLWHAPKDKILDKQVAETIQQAAAILVRPARCRAEGRAPAAPAAVLQGHSCPPLRQAVRLGSAADGQTGPGPL